MAGPIEFLGRMIARGGVGVARQFYGNSAGRFALSVGAGAIYGGATSDSVTSTGTFKDVAFGALMGAGLYAGAVGVGKYGKMFAASARGSYRSTFGGTIGPPKPGVFHGQAPSLRTMTKGTAILGGMGLGAYGLMSITEEPERDLGALAEQAGISSTGFDPGFGSDYEQQVHQRYMDSTQGLVQGMHRSRH